MTHQTELMDLRVSANPELLSFELGCLSRLVVTTAQIVPWLVRKMGSSRDLELLIPTPGLWPVWNKTLSIGLSLEIWKSSKNEHFS